MRGRKTLAQLLCIDAPVVVGEAHALVDDRAGHGQAYHRRFAGAHCFQVIGDRVFRSRVVGTGQSRLAFVCGPVGLREGEARIGAADITDQ